MAHKHKAIFIIIIIIIIYHRQAPLQHLPRGRTQWLMILPEGIWPSRDVPNILFVFC